MNEFLIAEIPSLVRLLIIVDTIKFGVINSFIRGNPRRNLAITSEFMHRNNDVRYLSLFFPLKKKDFA